MKYGYCGDCLNKGCCDKCYRGTYYESAEAKYYNSYDKNHEEPAII